MLILSRKAGEKLIIGENVTVTILAVKGNQIRIGIDAPRDVRVDREEIYQRILKEEKELNKVNATRAPAAVAEVPLRQLSISGKR